MEDKLYTATDCIETGESMFIAGAVIVVNADADIQPDCDPGQLFYCFGGRGAITKALDQWVAAISLRNGEPCIFLRGDIIGTAKPESIPDEAKLNLSKILRRGYKDVPNPEFRGYIFLEDGRCSAGTDLENVNDAEEYIKMQTRYQYRVKICDMTDSTVADIINGEVVYPDYDEYEAGNRDGIRIPSVLKLAAYQRALKKLKSDK